jgi:ABC-type sugar transport system ATPase subunit
MAKIRWENLTKDFGKVIAVNNLNLECEDGEFMALLGPSGCGKTTTLRMTAGLETPTSGEIYFDHQPINKLSPRERNVAMVFENYALYPHKSVFKNIAYPLELRSMPKADIEKKVLHAAKILEIETLLDRSPRQISGGQKQRVGIARALVREPSAFMMDEPLSHLDAKLRAYMRAELKRLQKDLGITTVFVTHDQLEAITMADRVALINFGFLQQYGPPHELYQSPANVFVARFIGEPAMNLLPCEIHTEGEQAQLVGKNLKLSLPPAMYRSMVDKTTSRKVLIGVRPQHLKIHLGNEISKDHNVLSGTVYVSELLGTELLVRVRVGEDLIQAQTEDSYDFKMDQSISLEIPPDRFFIFDAETEQRIV